MNLILKNTVIIGLVAFSSACQLTVSKDTTINSQDDRNYIIGDESSSQDGSSVSDSDQNVSDREGDGELPTSGLIKEVSEGGLVKIKEDQSVILVDLLHYIGQTGSKITSVESPNYGGFAQLRDDGSVQYTPKLDFHGVEYFKYHVTDINGKEHVATVILEVENVNDTPVASDDVVNSIEDEVVLLEDLLKNDSDVDGDKLVIMSTSQGTMGGIVSINLDNTLSYVPSKDFFGEESFSYTVSDGQGGSANGMVKVFVASVNDTPVAKPDNVVASQNVETLIDLGENDEGVGDGVQFSVISSPVNGSVAISENGVASYIPSADYFGGDEFSYQIVDNDGDVSFATVIIQIECTIKCSRLFNLTWDASTSTNVTSYKVYVGEAPDALDTVIELGNVTSYGHLVSIKGEYYFAVSAVNDSAIESELSVVQSAIF